MRFQWPRIVSLSLMIVWFSAVYAFVLAPLIVVAGASLDGSSKYAATFPPSDVSLDWFLAIPEAHYHAIGLSVILAVATTIAACLLGVPAAIGLVRSGIPGKPIVSAIFRAPLQIPSIVIGIAFMQLYYAIGRTTGWFPVGTFWGLVVGHVFHTTPYVIGTTVAVLQRFNVSYEEAAVMLGSSRLRAFMRVTLPIIAPGVYAGGLYAFMTSFGDVPIAIFLTAPGYATYPVELFLTMESDFDPSVLASATLVLLLSFVVMLVVQRLVGLDMLLRTSQTS